MPKSTLSEVAKQQATGLPDVGFVRLSSIIAPGGPLPISRSTWFAWLRDGRAPAPVKLSARITAYRVEDVHALLARLSQANTSA